jgi:Holliday junction resolvase RusA-like endonuclease
MSLPDLPLYVRAGRRVELELPIAPRSKERPRFSGRGKGHTFNTKAYTTWKDSIRAYMAEHYNLEPLTKDLIATWFFFSSKPPEGDVDGLIGGVMDALQPDQQGPLKDAPASYWLGKIAFWNDGQIRASGGIAWIPSAETAIGIILEEIQLPLPYLKPKQAAKKGTSNVQQLSAGGRPSAS